MQCPAVFDCDSVRSLRPGPKDKRRDQVICCQYRGDRARRALRGTGEQVKKAGQASVRRNRFARLSGGSRAVSRDLGAMARAPAGIRGYLTSPAVCSGGAPGHARVRDRRLPPAVPGREIVPDVPERPAGPAHLPPRPRLRRSPPAGRVHLAGRQLPDRRPRPCGRPAGSSAPPAGTAPQRSRPDRTSSPPPAPCPAACAGHSGPRLPARPRTPATSSPPDFVTRHCRPEQAGAPAPAAAPCQSFPAPPRPAAGKHAAGTYPGSTPGAVSCWDKPAAAARRAPPRGQYRNAPAPLTTAHHAEIGQRPAGAARNLSQPGFRRAYLSRAGYRVLSAAVAEPERAGDKREA
jgi:hypothetical protein